MNSQAKETFESALVDVCDIAYELAGYQGKLGEFAHSCDEPDRMHADAMRDRIVRIARTVMGLSDGEIEQVHAALEYVCATDEYAAKELAGRFMSAVRRSRMAAALRRHRNAWKFETLIRAITKGRYTKAQWTLAQNLAAEV